MSSGAGRLHSSGCRSRKEESITEPGAKLVVVVLGIRCYPWNTYMCSGFWKALKLPPELRFLLKHSVWNSDHVIH